MTQDLYSTLDMGLAAYLEMQGHRPVNIQYVGRRCQWTFVSSEDVLNDSEDYSTGKAIVEPTKYNSFFAQAKDELLNSPGRPPRHT